MKGVRVSRRAFFRLAALMGIGAGLAAYRELTKPIHPVWYLRWKLRGLYQQRFGAPAIVAIEPCNDYHPQTVYAALKRAWELAEMPSLADKRVFIKPNLVDALDQAPHITSAPQGIAALIDLLRELGVASLAVGDGPAFRREVSTIARQVGLDVLLSQRGVPLIDLNYDDPQPVPARDGWFPGVSQLWLPRSILEADVIISLARLKTHHWAQISLCLKNLLGIFPGVRYGWPKNFIHFSGISESILGLYQVLPKVVGVIDGVVGMEGDGPLFGSPVPHGVLVVGQDAAAVDTVGKVLMGFSQWEVGYLNLAAWAGVGQTVRIETRGLTVETASRIYQRPPAIG